MSKTKLFNIEDYHEQAKKFLPKMVYDYYKSGADDEITLNENRKDYTKIKLIPRVLIDVNNLNTAITVLGQKISFPIIVAPTAMQKMATPEGEISTARATNKMKTLMVLSTSSTTSMEDVSKEMTSGLLWYQLYVTKDRSLTLNMIQRAEKSGYKAICITVDAPILGNRESDHRNQFKLPAHLTMPNVQRTDGMEDTKSGSGLNIFFSTQFDKSLNWTDIDWIKKQTKLPIVLKGIVSYEDTKLAIQHKVDAIVVSNHGGRQLDTCISTIQALPMVVQAAKDCNSKIEIYVDGGIRRGTDVLKAIALGARAVLIGRPVLWGLSVNGEQGVENVLKLLQKEFESAMSLCGCQSLSDINSSLIYKKSKL